MSISSTFFRWQFCPFSGGPCHQQATSSVHYTISCKHSLVLLRMGEIIARNMLSWLKLLINCFIVASSWLFIQLYQWCAVTQTSNVHYTISCKHSLVLLRMGEIIVRNMLSWLKLLINCFIVASSWLFILIDSTSLPKSQHQRLMSLSGYVQCLF